MKPESLGEFTRPASASRSTAAPTTRSFVISMSCFVVLNSPSASVSCMAPYLASVTAAPRNSLSTVPSSAGQLIGSNLKAYVVAQNVVKDEARYMKDFAPSMSKAIEAAGGKYLVRGGKTISMHGAAPASRVVILQFDSVDKAQAWANAAATKALFATGEKYATLNDYIVEGDSDFRPCCSQQQFKRSSLNRHRLLR